ncbi:MAG TPA: cytochrome c [Sphingomicrobium sp.]|nr:cytochrome c [Sphingomicrobium sp.]
MRAVLFALALPLVSIAACSGSQTSQIHNGQANVSTDSRSAENATGSNLELRLSLGDATRIMHERHEGMETIGKNAKAINRELAGPSPDLAVVRGGAAQIAELSTKASGWFPEGTGPEAGKTGAKPDIWQNRADFETKLHNFQGAAAAFDAAAKSGDVPRIKARFAELGGACKACHDKYRAEMHH